MHVPPGISDEAADALVELCFHRLPAMDGEDMAAFLGAVLRIAEREVRRAVRKEEERWNKPGEN